MVVSKKAPLFGGATDTFRRAIEFHAMSPSGDGDALIFRHSLERPSTFGTATETVL
jgi:hypothetical protein